MNYLQDKGKDYIKNIYDKQSLSFHKKNLRDLILSTLNGHTIICILVLFPKRLFYIYIAFLRITKFVLKLRKVSIKNGYKSAKKKRETSSPNIFSWFTLLFLDENQIFFIRRIFEA